MCFPHNGIYVGICIIGQILCSITLTLVTKAATEYQPNQFPGDFLISSQLSLPSKFSTIVIYPRMYVCFLFKSHLLGSELNVLTIVQTVMSERAWPEPLGSFFLWTTCILMQSLEVVFSGGCLRTTRLFSHTFLVNNRF